MIPYKNIILKKNDMFYRTLGILSNYLISISVLAVIIASAVYLIFPSSDFTKRCITFIPYASCGLLFLAFILRRIFAIANKRNVSLAADKIEKTVHTDK